jgi:cell wall-associated NlpC family hydrolase
MSPSEGFSCSGLVTYLLPRAGIITPQLCNRGDFREVRTTSDYERLCETVSWDESRRGDLLLFTKRSNNGEVLNSFHMGILLQRRIAGGAYIHAPGLENSWVEVDQDFSLVPNHVWDQPELLPDYMQIRRIPSSWDALG